MPTIQDLLMARSKPVKHEPVEKCTQQTEQPEDATIEATDSQLQEATAERHKKYKDTLLDPTSDNEYNTLCGLIDGSQPAKAPKAKQRARRDKPKVDKKGAKQDKPKIAKPSPKEQPGKAQTKKANQAKDGEKEV